MLTYVISEVILDERSWMILDIYIYVYRQYTHTYIYIYICTYNIYIYADLEREHNLFSFDSIFFGRFPVVLELFLASLAMDKVI